MPDVETRLARSLRAAAESAPAAEGLEVAARSRLRRRRTTSGAVAATALAVVAVTMGISALPHGNVPTATWPTNHPSASSASAEGYRPAPAGWRWETGNGLQALVPDSWGYGVDLTDRCNRSTDPHEPGAVEVPGVHSLVGCGQPAPPTGYKRFLAFWDVARSQTVGRWQTVRRHVPGTASGVVTVRDDDLVELRRILDSVRPVGVTDHNGCPGTTPALTHGDWRPAALTVVAGTTPDVVSVCRYGSQDRPGEVLSFSTVLSPARAGRVHEALWRAPTLTLTRAACLDVRFPVPVVLIRERFPQGWRTTVVRLTGCPSSTDDGTARRAVSREVARAALIGYREGVPSGVGGLAGNWILGNHR